MFPLGKTVRACRVHLLVLLVIGPDAALAGTQFQMHGFAGAALNGGVSAALVRSSC